MHAIGTFHSKASRTGGGRFTFLQRQLAGIPRKVYTYEIRLPALEYS